MILILTRVFERGAEHAEHAAGRGPAFLLSFLHQLGFVQARFFPTAAFRADGNLDDCAFARLNLAERHGDRIERIAIKLFIGPDRIHCRFGELQYRALDETVRTENVIVAGLFDLGLRVLGQDL